MALHIPNTLKLTHLKQIAFKCGISSSGTKPLLISRLQDEISLATQSPLPTPQTPIRILSIDMGIRNLAYCILDLKSGSGLPIVQSWHRIAVSQAPVATVLEDYGLPKMIEKMREKESFSPATLSQTAYGLLKTRLLTHNPTHILIERQRFRSMGSKHILEWTIRVNMFESILYAVLYTLKAEGLWKGSVEAIAPGKVGPYWVDEEADLERDEKKTNTPGVKVRKTKNPKARNKGAKIDLVRKWLVEGEMVKLGNEGVEGVARAYKEKYNRAPGGGPAVLSEGGEKMGKLDDLADSLLQGMAWIQWQKNKRCALQNGVLVLLDP